MKLFKALYVRWITFVLGIRSFRKLNIGDFVSYRGSVWQLTQGACDPKWTLSNAFERREMVHRDDFDKIMSIRNHYRSFRQTWRFFKGYWWSIWVQYSWKDLRRLMNHPKPEAMPIPEFRR